MCHQPKGVIMTKDNKNNRANHLNPQDPKFHRSRGDSTKQAQAKVKVVTQNNQKKK